MRYNKDNMKKLKIYLDTSIVSAAVDNREPEKKLLSNKLIDEIKQGKHEAYISELLHAEVDKAKPQDIILLRGVINKLNCESLIIDKEVRELADQYIKQKVIRTKWLNDAVHIAIASVNNMDVIISWNFKHIVKVRTKMAVKGINALMGYKDIEIYSPLEVVRDV